ncbi:hypothetical protein GCM10009678_78720 [Actinomadura kijaniata]
MGPGRALVAGVGLFVLTMAVPTALWTSRPVPVSAQALAMNTSVTYLGAAPLVAATAGLVALILLLLTACGGAPNGADLRGREDRRPDR